jgi:hypothetical protein
LRLQNFERNVRSVFSEVGAIESLPVRLGLARAVEPAIASGFAMLDDS